MKQVQKILEYSNKRGPEGLAAATTAATQYTSISSHPSRLVSKRLFNVSCCSINHNVVVKRDNKTLLLAKKSSCSVVNGKSLIVKRKTISEKLGNGVCQNDNLSATVETTVDESVDVGRNIKDEIEYLKDLKLKLSTCASYKEKV